MELRKHSDLLIGFLAALVVGLIMYGLNLQGGVALNKTVRGQVGEQLEGPHHLLESWVNAAFFLPRGLVSYIGTHPELEPWEPLNGMVNELFRYHEGIRGLVLAPEGRQWLRYSANRGPVPVPATELLPPAVKEAMEGNRSILVGALQAATSRSVATVHIPVYIPSGQGETAGSYWGRVLVELDMEAMLHEAVERSDNEDIELAVREVTSAEGHADMMVGDPALFEQQPVVMEVSFPGGRWRLGGVPVGGWSSAMPALLWLQIASLVVVVLVGMGVFLYLRQQVESWQQLEKALKNAEEARAALAESETFLKTIVDNIPDMIFVKNASDLRFVRMNKAGEELIGYSQDALLGKNDYDFFPVEEADHFTSNDREVLNNRALIDIPCEAVQTRDGGIRYLHTKKISLLDPHGNPAFLMGISRDITGQIKAQEERERLEGQLRQSLKMESIGTLAGGIAHDFNNILAAILGYTELAQEEAGANTNLQLALSQVTKAGNRARDLVQHILSFSRKEAREAEPIELHQVIADALKLLRATIPSNIEFELELPDCGRVMADATRIHQVVMNICTNAAQAMRESGGLLSVQLSPVALESGDRNNGAEVKPGTYLHLRVTDTGQGIPAENLDRIFDPYFTTKPVGEGTGMGLSVVMGIVKSYGGMVSVSSEPDRGTTVDVYFPRLGGGAAEAPAAPEVAPRAREGESEWPAVSPRAIAAESGASGVSALVTGIVPGGGETILVVDDEPSVADVTRMTVEQLGYTAISVTDSTQALELFRCRPDDFQMVITDQNMPGLTGDALAKALLAIRPDLPVVMCTGYSARLDAAIARQTGARAFIMKPLDRRELANTLVQLLGEPVRKEATAKNWRDPETGSGES